MRVLVLSQYYWPETFRITEVVGALRAADVEVAVLTGQPNYPDGEVFPGYSAMSTREEVHEGTQIWRVPMLPRGRGSALRLVGNYLSFIISAACVGPWLLRRQRFDVVLVYAPSPILQAIPAVAIARLKRARLVTWVQDLWPESLEVTGFIRNRRALMLVAGVVRWIYRRNDLLLVQSQAFESPVRRLAPYTPIEYFPNPGDGPVPSVARADEPPLRLGEGFTIVFAGNLGTVQALDTVLAAASELRDLTDVRFILVGSGSRSDWLREAVQKAALLNVDLPGRFPPAAMPAILEQASVLLVSLAKQPILAQTVPSKLQSYLAAGKPILASLDGEGARVVGEAEAGIATPAEDASALAAAARRLYAATPAERLAMGARARAYYDRHFDPQKLGSRLVGILSSVAQLGATVSPTADCTGAK